MNRIRSEWSRLALKRPCIEQLKGRIINRIMESNEVFWWSPLSGALRMHN